MTLRTILPAILLAVAAGGTVPQVALAQSPAQSYVYRQKHLRHYCRPPLKFAAGACVRRCPSGYRNNGGYCRLLNQRQR